MEIQEPILSQLREPMAVEWRGADRMLLNMLPDLDVSALQYLAAVRSWPEVTVVFRDVALWYDALMRLESNAATLAALSLSSEDGVRKVCRLPSTMLPLGLPRLLQSIYGSSFAQERSVRDMVLGEYEIVRAYLGDFGDFTDNAAVLAKLCKYNGQRDISTLVNALLDVLAPESGSLSLFWESIAGSWEFRGAHIVLRALMSRLGTDSISASLRDTPGAASLIERAIVARDSPQAGEYGGDDNLSALVRGTRARIAADPELQAQHVRVETE